MVETLGPGRTMKPARDGDKQQGSCCACLVVAFDAARPLDPASRHWLLGVDEASLGRSDLGRVSEYGSVKVRDLMRVERYSHVMHLVSSIEGRLRPGLDALDALAACFPAGTLTGAPKVRAMEIIEELEPVRRGVYGGAVLYADFAGNLDSCIAIRTMLMKGRCAYVQAGAGIVADSDPKAELAECRNKAKALLRAAELARRGGH